jgi:hypothetical protein
VPNVVQLVAVIHEDVTEKHYTEHLKNICKTYIHVQNTNNPLVLNLRLEHKRSNGKCVVQVTNFIFILHYIFYLYIILFI